MGKIIYSRNCDCIWITFLYNKHVSHKSRTIINQKSIRELVGGNDCDHNNIRHNKSNDKN